MVVIHSAAEDPAGEVGFIGIAGGDGKAIQDSAAVQRQVLRMVEDVVAVVVKPVRIPDVAAEDGLVRHPVAVLEPGFLVGLPPAIDGHAVHHLEGSRAGVVADELPGRLVDPRCHPDLIPGCGLIQRILQVGVGMLPRPAVVESRRVRVDIDYASCLRQRALSPGDDQDQRRCQRDHHQSPSQRLLPVFHVTSSFPF